MAKGIIVNTIFDTLEKYAIMKKVNIVEIAQHMKNAYSLVYCKFIDADAELDFTFDEKKRVFEVKKKLEIVSNDPFPLVEIDLKSAKRYYKNCKIGEKKWFVLVETSTLFKEELMKKLKEFLDRDKNTSLEKKYKEKIGDLIWGEVTVVKYHYVLIDVGDCVATLERIDQIRGEKLIVGKQICAIVKEIILEPLKFNLKLERNTTQFIQKLFEFQIEEIEDGTIEIKRIARIPGKKSAIFVSTDDLHIHPVTTCIGKEASRIKAISSYVDEAFLITRYSLNIETRFLNMFRKGVIADLYYDGKMKVMNVWIDDTKKQINKDGEEISNYAFLYGKLYVNLRLALDACDLFDIRIFDINITPKEIIIGFNESKEDKFIVKDESLVDQIIRDREKQNKLSQIKPVIKTKIKKKEEIDLLEDKDIEEKIIIDKIQHSQKNVELKQNLRPKETKVVKIVDEKQQKTSGVMRFKKSIKDDITIDMKDEEIEVETVKRKRQQKDKTKDFLEKQRAKLKLEIGKFDDIQEEDEEEEYDDYDYYDSYGDDE